MTKVTTAFTIPEEMIDGLTLLGYTRKKSRSQLVVDAIEAAYGSEIIDLSARFAAVNGARERQSEPARSKKSVKK